MQKRKLEEVEVEEGVKKIMQLIEKSNQDYFSNKLNLYFKSKLNLKVKVY